MIYTAYQIQADLAQPIRFLAWAARRALEAPLPGLGNSFVLRRWAALCELVERAALTHTRPAFGLSTVQIGNREVPVREVVTARTPFATLLNFAKDVDTAQPRLLVVAPMSGHFATLLRGTVQTLLPDHDVYITDWHNIRDVRPEHGRFGLDEYIDHVIGFLEAIGPGTHVLAVCQPCVQTLAAAAIMEAQGNPAQPRSMTLMAGPIDTRINPTKVNELATSRTIQWFEQNLIARVPLGFAGAGRRVYPGFVQLSAFMRMNLDRHIQAHLDLFGHLVKREREPAAVTKAFYDEYFAVLDLPAEFYIETVRDIFQEYLLARGLMTWRGEPIDPGIIRRTALLTVEGERDDICSLGQTVAAQDLCRSLRPYKKRHHMQPGVGHYGVFSGRRWANQVYPLVKNTILAND